jgi:hypothetical protein
MLRDERLDYRGPYSCTDKADTPVPPVRVDRMIGNNSGIIEQFPDEKARCLTTTNELKTLYRGMLCALLPISLSLLVRSER